MAIEDLQQHEELIRCLMDSACWPAGGGDRRRIDTHISTVLLAGGQALKIKKPLDLGFLDFRSLAARRQACAEELRLNGRLAPDIYLAVVPITGSAQAPVVDGPGEPIDWAVLMRRFDPDAILSSQLHRLDADLIDRLACRVASMHAGAPTLPPDPAYGTADVAYAPMADNFGQLFAAAPSLRSTLQALFDWTQRQRGRLQPTIARRRAEGFVRECHGDLHLANVALIDGEPVIFDAIEFDPALRWIDCMNDIAFMVMDLQARGRGALAHRFLDRYLQETGDYAGVAVLRYYVVYRALVRAKIAAIRAAQPLDEAERAGVMDELAAYVHLAGELAASGDGALLITHGVSGSGKSYAAAGLVQTLPALRIRSDVERKRLLGLPAEQDATAHGAYAQDLTRRTYQRLAECAEVVAASGYVAVADATFLRRSQRAAMQDLAARLGVPFLILDCDAPAEVLRERILARRQQSGNVSDADLSVLESQLAQREPLSAEERAMSVTVRPQLGLDAAALKRRLTNAHPG
jgi:aminoglycoside phosphotransferase family enzyme/gluconate kinase